jgi:murein DD-endopeptidase MepM/ murein hydrolase activator NlpD
MSSLKLSPLAVTFVLLLGSCGGGGEDGRNDGGGDCASYGSAAASPYRLPWYLGQTYEASPHINWDPSAQRYAYDIKMPVGTDILAIRAGTVVRVEESFLDGDHTPGHENHVYVRHDDGTGARYVHLTNLGALVRVGDVVLQGQHIGLSGDTGNSSAPHLHFDITLTCCTTPPDNNALPAGETLPLNFSNSDPVSSCGLLNGGRYTALP